MLKKNSQFKILCLLAIFLTPACGGSYLNSRYSLTPVSYTQQNSCTCPKKKKKTNTVKKETPAVVTSSKPVTEGTPVKDVTPTPSPTPEAKVEEKKESNRGRELLTLVLNKISSAKAIKMDMAKFEKSLTTSETVENEVDFYFKNPNQVRVEVKKHSTNSMAIGSKVYYVSGSGKVKVKAGGMLGVFPLELDMKDKQVVSLNNFTPEQSDVISLTKRMKSADYQAELTGKTTFNGKEVFLLKVTSNTTNSVDPRIKYEQIGFEKDTFKLVLWEMYAENSTSPFMKITIKSFELLADLADDKLKI